jgi:hypothetical protein
MNIDWRQLIFPLELFGVLALTGSCLLYALVLHVKMKAVSKRDREQHEDLHVRVTQAAEAVEQLRSQLEEAERRRPAPTLPGPALNLTKRGQVLRMRRRGETPETIAGALGVPRNEVDLLLKVHHLALDHADQAVS